MLHRKFPVCRLMECLGFDSSIHGIFQARVLEGGAISFSTGKQWADSKPWKGEGGAGEHVSKGAARSLCPCLGKQASLCPLPHPCPSAELTAREKLQVKRGHVPQLLNLCVLEPMLCHKRSHCNEKPANCN